MAGLRKSCLLSLLACRCGSSETLVLANFCETCDGPFFVYDPELVLLQGQSRILPRQHSLRYRGAAGSPEHLDVPEGRHILVLLRASGLEVLDTNDAQVELSRARSLCEGRRASSSSSSIGPPLDCMAQTAFGGGLPQDYLEEAFRDLWIEDSFWRLCNAAAPQEPLRSFQNGAGQRVDVLREEPRVAAVRGFMSREMCAEVVRRCMEEELSRARVGGVGQTSTSEARETLTSSLHVNWDEQEELFARYSASVFDLASELLGANVSYEGQEPVNFLHYIKGFEYRPHTDGAGDRMGKRVATTLVYCETAEDGGGTVFPRGTAEQPPLRFQPRVGDLLFFQYAPGWLLQEHAACPVLHGSKSTLTQWHRLGVSPGRPWWKFEAWGKFGSPHAQSRWRGPRYGFDAATANRLLDEGAFGEWIPEGPPGFDRFSVEVHREGGTFGFLADGQLRVLAVVEGGALEAFNRQQPHRRVLVGDRFAVVNGASVRTKSDLLAALEGTDTMRAILERVSPESAEARPIEGKITATFANAHGQPLSLFWRPPDGEEDVFVCDVAVGAEAPQGTYEGHVFVSRLSRDPAAAALQVLKVTGVQKHYKLRGPQDEL